MDGITEAYCDSDEEVFFGPLTLREIKKALTLKRKTEVFHPMKVECNNEGAAKNDAEENTAPQDIAFTCKSPECVGDSPTRDAETPAPPPSPELSGSPYPTPYRTRPQPFNNLREIAEEDDCIEVPRTVYEHNSSPRYTNVERFRKWRENNPLEYSSDESDESASVLPSQSVAQESSNTRHLLIEKMKQHKERTRQLLSTKKQSTGVPRVEILSSEGSNDDVISLNVSEIKFSSDECAAASPEENPLEDEVLIDNNTENKSNSSTTDEDNKSDSCKRFSRLSPERDSSVASSDSLECCDDIELLSNTEEQTSPLKPNELNDSLRLEDGASVRPEFDVEESEPHVSACSLMPVMSHSYSVADYSLISDAEDPLELSHKGDDDTNTKNPAAVNVDKEGGFLSVLSEAAVLHATLQHNIQDEPPLLTVTLWSEVQGAAPAEDHSFLTTDKDDQHDEIQEIYSTNCGTSEPPGMEMDATGDLNDSDRRRISSFVDGGEFNDTLEEVEMLMKYGMDYVMSGNGSIMSTNASTPKNPIVDSKKFEDFGDAISEKDQHKDEVKADEALNKIPSETGLDVVVPESARPASQTTPVRKLPQTKAHSTTKMQAVVSPIVKPSPFKIPTSTHLTLRTAKKSPLKPVPVVSPCRKPVNYKKIMSPVGAYIHNTPSPSLVTIVKPKPLHMTPNRSRGRCVTPVRTKEVHHKSLEVAPHAVEERGIENVDTTNIRPVLPVVSYESVPAVKLEEPAAERMPRLNEKMKKLVDTPRPRIHCHKGRMKVTPSPQMRNARLYNLGSQSCSPNDSVASTSPGEISVIVGKQVTRSNTLGY